MGPWNVSPRLTTFSGASASSNAVTERCTALFSFAVGAVLQPRPVVISGLSMSGETYHIFTPARLNRCEPRRPDACYHRKAGDATCRTGRAQRVSPGEAPGLRDRQPRFLRARGMDHRGRF